MAKQEKAAIFEDPEALAESYSKAEEWIKKNRKILSGAVIAVIVAVAAVIYLKKGSDEENMKANGKIFPAQFYFGLDSNNVALNGADSLGVQGFSKIAKKYEGTDAANLSNFYAGVILLKNGEYTKSIKKLETFDCDDLLLKARKHALIGDANMQLKKYKKAADSYRMAAEYKPNKQFTPEYLSKLAFAYLAANKPAEAVVEFEKIIKVYPKYSNINEVKKYKAYAKGLASSK